MRTRVPTSLLCLLAIGGSSQALAVRNGELAGSNDFPNVGRLGHGCSGVLVAPNRVLTAAHCVKPYGPEEIKRLPFMLTQPDGSLKEHILADSVAILSPYADGDLAIVSLSKAASGFRAQPLAHNWETLPTLANVVGYGPNSDAGVFGRKLFGTVTLTQYFRAQPNSRFSGQWPILAAEPGPENQFGCPGDSGGAVYLQNERGEFELIGIIGGALTAPRDRSQECDYATEMRILPIPAHAEWIQTQLAL